ncbi:MAG: CDP-glucose 4,6-dehydratase [Gaiellaceae bacterium]
MAGFWSGRRVFLTGHAGFKGSWLALWLASAGARVVGYSDRAPTTPALYELAGVEELLAHSVRGDVRNGPALAAALAAAEPEIVFHLAAQPLVRRSLADPVGTYETNVMGTVNLLEAVRTTPSVRVVVNVTTDKVYANRDSHAGYREDEPLGGDDPYSSSKAAAELVTAAYRVSFGSGPAAARIATARAGNVIGGGDWAEDRLVPDLMRAALGHGRVVVRNPRSTRPWQHVLNASAGYLLLAERLWEDPSLADAWNFGPEPDDVHPVSWIVERISALWGEELLAVPPDRPQPAETVALTLDSTRARTQLGWQPRWGSERCLRSIVEWYRAFAAGESVRKVTLDQIVAYADNSAAVTAAS